MGDVGQYLLGRLAQDWNALPAQALCIGLAALFSYFVWRKKKHLYRPVEPTPGVRVFSEELGNWPQVYRQDDGGYWVVALHWPPGLARYDNNASAGNCIVGFAVLALALWFFSMVAAVAAVIASIPIMRGWPEYQPFEPVLMVSRQGLLWVTPGGGRGTAPLTFKMRVQVPHRKADAEARQHEMIVRQQALDRENALRRVSMEEQKFQERKQDALRRLSMADPKYQKDVADGKIGHGPVRMYSDHIPDPSPPHPEYQTASELIIMTGAGDQIWQVMAEFRNDEHGERANQLYHAINRVRNECLREMRDAGAAVPVLAGPDSLQQAVAPSGRSASPPTERFE